MGIKKKSKLNSSRLGQGFVPNYTLLYTLVFLFMTVVVFHYFLVWGRVSVWYYDGKTQNYNALVYIGVWGRDLLKNIFINHSFEIPTYSFTLGYGGDVVQFLHFYGLGDPFNLLSVFVPSGKTIFLYHILIIVRLYLAGYAFSRMCLYFNKNIDRYAVLAGALAYVFGAYALISATRHPYFVNPMIYMPMLIIGMEKIRQKKSPLVFVFGVFLSAVSNFYFLYQLALFSVLYLISKMIFDRKKYTAKENVFYLLKLAAYALLGASLAGAIFVPVLVQAINDPRMGVGAYVPLLYEKKLYAELLKDFISSDSIPEYWTCIGMGGVVIPALYTLFVGKGKRAYLKVVAVALILFAVVPFFGHVFNGMSYISNRWIWLLALALAYVIAVTVEDLAKLSSKDILRILVILIAYFALCFIFRESFTSSAITQLLIACAEVIVITALISSGKIARFAGITVLVAVIIGVALNAFFIYSPTVSDFLSEYNYASYFNKSFNANEADLLSKKYKDDEFSRYSGTSMTKNAALLNGQSTTQFYYSLSNPNVFEFFDELNTNATIGQRYDDLNDSTFLNTLVDVKYFTLGTGDFMHVGRFINNPKLDSDIRVPYGYDRKGAKIWAYTSKGLKKKNTGKFKKNNILGAFSVYENENFLPFGYTYSGAVSRSEYSKLSPLQKQEALLQGVVLDKNVDTVKSITPRTSSQKIDYKIKSLTGVTQKGKKFIANGEVRKITFELSGGLDNSETYIRFKNIGFKGIKVTDLYNDDKSIDPNDEYTEKDWKSFSPAQRRELDKEASEYIDRTKLDFKLKYDGITKEFDYRTPNDIYYQGRQDYLINLNYREKPLKTVTLKLPYRGVYSFDEISFYGLPMDGYEKRVEALGEDVLTDVNFHDENNSCSTNEITGNISLKENKILCLTIPYSKDWTAYVDGKEVEILRANTAFSGLELTRGSHKIKLVYHTSGFKFGIVLSGVGVLALAALIVLEIIRKKRSKKKLRYSEYYSEINTDSPICVGLFVVEDRKMAVKAKTKNFSLLSKDKFPNYWIMYTLVFLLLAAFAYHYFMIFGKATVLHGDGDTQNYNTLVYIGIWFRDIIKNIFVNHSLSIPTYSFSLGYGGDIVQLLHYYVFGDPFSIFSTFVPSSKTMYLYSFLILLRLYLAGLAFSKLCFYLNKGIDKFAVLAGALAYVFCAYTLVWGPCHPYFINPMIYLPMIIIGLEKIRQKESAGYFVFGVFFSLTSNIYFLYIIAVFSVLYLIGKMIFDRKKYTAKENVLYILRLAGYSLLSLTMAAVVLFPIVIQVIKDPRFMKNTYIPLFYDTVFYRRFLKYYIVSSGRAAMFTDIGMGGLVIPSLYVLFSTRKKRTYLKVIVIALTAFALIPYFGHFFNAMSYISNRWVFVLVFALAYTIAVGAEGLIKFKTKDCLLCLGFFALYTIAVLVSWKAFTNSTLIQIAVALVAVVIVLLVSISKKSRTYLGAAIALAAMVSVGFNMSFTYKESFMNDYCRSKGFFSQFNANEANLLKYQYKDDEFYRYSGTSLMYNAALFNGISSTQFYYSLSNPNLFEFFDELHCNVTIGQKYKDLDDSASLNTLANVKYFSLGTGAKNSKNDYAKIKKIENLQKRVPYGFDTDNPKHWVIYKNGRTTAVKEPTECGKTMRGTFSIYENKNFLPFGYTYSSYIPRSEYKKLNPVEKQEAMLQGVVLDKKTDKLKSVTPVTNVQKIKYKPITDKDATVKGNKIITTKNKVNVILELKNNTPGCETYIDFKNINFKSTSAQQLYSNDKSVDPNNLFTPADWKKLSPEKQSSLNAKSESAGKRTKLIFKLSCEKIKKAFDFRTEQDIYYQGRKDYKINLDYTEQPKKKIKLTLPLRGVYTFDSIDVYNLPMDGYEKQVSALRQDVLQNVDFHNDNGSMATSEITGDISLKENKFLCLTIPYSKDWTAYVDGKEVEILRANTAFSGLALTKGNHKIKLVYHTPGFKVGIVLSVVGFLALIALAVVRIIRRKRKNQLAHLTHATR